MATIKEEKQFEKERRAAKKARERRMKADGLEKYLTPDQIKYNRRQKAINSVWPVFRFLILFGLCFVILYPLIFMLSTAFRPNEQMNDPSIIWIPKNFTMQNIKESWKVMKFEKTLVNTIILNLVASVLQVITCSLTGYGFARFKFKGKKILFGLVVMMIIVPPQITTIPLYMQYAYPPKIIARILTLGKATKLIDSPWTMYLPALFANGIRAGLFIFIFRQFFRGLPKELEDAAYLDGCSPLYTYVKIMIPNAKQSFLTVFLFSIVWYWNDYYVSSSFFTNNDTVALMLKNLNNTLIKELFNNQSVSVRQIIVWLEAGCLLSITPILVMYVFLQRYFVEGIEKSGLAN
ncbi:carbohydrate ABC transporter permease [Ruminococcus albus]|uniref:Binding-protein-dependent transport systems inner membrane component n=1 Tax=Ruminococcus albus (strain ATCC 27210 / DSM 20455 / JCM 14654 / NCDO 2250 / 7) TaxID=697329 RepID=E6UFX0_RUMA7|nr:carbohydrate ABC transporter permease [Ruminococcus albus]ADU23644.1 binding-protein-dependent transport systems inner membrane component [Ruminococcus albus 7 = DSM 20455]